MVMRRLLLVLLTSFACLALVSARAHAQAPYTCTLHVGTNSATVDSCKAVTPPAPPPPAPAPPPPPPAPAPPPPPPAPAPPPPPVAQACGRTNALRVVNVANGSALHAALAAAKPGDAIVMADGTYSGAGELRISTGGTASQPISLCGSAKAIIDAGSQSSTTGIVAANAAYWKFSGFTVTNGLFGIYATNAPGASFKNLTIFAIGQEALSLKLNSNHDTVSGSRFYDTGKKVAEYGEAIYVGTASPPTPDRSDSVVIDGNTFGPNVRAESIDAKEYTHGGIIRNNTFDGSGEVESQGSGESGWPNSPVILQGVGYVVTNNTVTHPLIAAFRVVYHGTVETGTDNSFSGNTVDAGGAGYGFLIQAGAGTPSNTVKCDNKVTNASKGLANVSCKP